MNVSRETLDLGFYKCCACPNRHNRRNQRYCHSCHAAYQRDWKKHSVERKVKEMLQQLANIISEPIANKEVSSS